MSWRRRVVQIAVVAGLCAGAVAGCASGEPTDATQSSSVAPASLSRDDNLAARLPERIRESGRLGVGTHQPYAPNEFTDTTGTLVGFDVDVVTELAHLLGVTPEFTETPFPEIIPGVESGKFDLGMRSFFDTVERERVVDMVTYYSAGTRWAQQSGRSIDPANACGLRVAVNTGTLQELAEIPAKSTACTTLGMPPIVGVPFSNQADATAALIAGSVDAMSADSPATDYAVAQSDGRLAAAGAVFDTYPYGFPIAKGSPLGPVMVDAVQRLIDTGQLKKIADKWGLADGLITTSRLNGAMN